MPNNLKMLAFDYGASNGRAILGCFNGSRLEIEEIHRFSNDPVMHMDDYYWDILRLYHEMVVGIGKCNKKGNDISSIGVDTWGVDFGLLDNRGELLGIPHHYRDVRTDKIIEEVEKIIPREELYRQSGVQIEKYNTLFQLMAMKKSKSVLFEKADSLLFMPDLFNYFLAGEKANEYTIASTSQLCNPYTKNWSKKLIKLLGIKKDIFQKLIEAGTMLGHTGTWINRQTGTGKLKVAAVAGHDTACAVFSVPVAEENYAYLSCGTWSILGIESPNPIINDRTYKLNYTNEGGVFGKYRVLKNIAGLWIYQECKRFWDNEGVQANFDELESMACQTDKFRSFIDPEDESFYSPGDMPAKIIEYSQRTGQKIPEGKGQIVRCIMESLALKYRMVFEGLESVTGYPIPLLHIIGGGCKNAMLCSFTANAIQRQVIAGPVEATAVGNLLGQMVAHGELSDIHEARLLVNRSFNTIEYLPHDSAEWDEAYLRFEKIVKKSSGKISRVNWKKF